MIAEMGQRETLAGLGGRRKSTRKEKTALGRQRNMCKGLGEIATVAAA